MKSSTKTTLIGIAIVVIAAAGYFYVEGGSPAASSTLVQSQAGNQVGTAELDLLNQIESLRIDTSLFSDPGYLSLTDYSVQIPSESVGRPNPFAPLSGTVAPASSQTGAPRLP
ncbi:MAG: hypothetical protein KGI69_00775 [Patescibacteria group bacterium]|nr:hypothetical protein [Patescibacteria group bacterium]